LLFVQNKQACAYQTGNGHFLLPKPTLIGGVPTNSYSNNELRLTILLLLLLCLIQMVRRTTVIGVDLAVGLKIPPSFKIDVCVIKLIIPPSLNVSLNDN